MTAAEWDALERDPRVRISTSGSWLEAEDGGDER